MAVDEAGPILGELAPGPRHIHGLLPLLTFHLHCQCAALLSAYPVLRRVLSTGLQVARPGHQS
jgi:hypothetical protein